MNALSGIPSPLEIWQGFGSGQEAGYGPFCPIAAVARPATALTALASWLKCRVNTGSYAHLISAVPRAACR